MTDGRFAQPAHNSPSIWPQGRFWPMDADGHILNDGDAEKLDPIYDIAIRQTVSALHRNLKSTLHSAYITGAVARGLSCPGASDLEVRAVLRRGATLPAIQPGWIEMAAGVAAAGQIAAQRVDLRAYNWHDVFPGTERFSWAAFELASTGVCLWGEDLTEELPLLQPGPAIANRDIVRLEDTLSDMAQALTVSVPSSRVREHTRIAAEAVLLAGGAFVMEEEMVYTRDLDLARDLFLLHFPEHKADMHEAYRLARRPSHDAEAGHAFVERVRAWMVPMANRWLDRHNPYRQMAMPLPE